MSVKKLRLMCLIWSDEKPNPRVFEVEIDDNRTVARLTKLIKGKYAHRLHKVDAPDLVLWKCSIPADDKLQENLATIRFDASDARLHCLPATSPLSKHFATDLPNETIHILVEVPALGHGECGPRIPYSTTEP